MSTATASQTSSSAPSTAAPRMEEPPICISARRHRNTGTPEHPEHPEHDLDLDRIRREKRDGGLSPRRVRVAGEYGRSGPSAAPHVPWVSDGGITGLITGSGIGPPVFEVSWEQQLAKAPGRRWVASWPSTRDPCALCSRHIRKEQRSDQPPRTALALAHDATPGGQPISDHCARPSAHRPLGSCAASTSSMRANTSYTRR